MVSSKRKIDQKTRRAVEKWNSNFALIARKRIKTKQGLFLLAFITGVALSIVWSVNNSWHSSSSAAQKEFFDSIQKKTFSRCSDVALTDTGGAYLAYTETDKDTGKEKVVLRNIRNDKQEFTFRGLKKITGLDLSPDGKFLAINDNNQRAVVYSIKTEATKYISSNPSFKILDLGVNDQGDIIIADELKAMTVTNSIRPAAGLTSPQVLAFFNFNQIQGTEIDISKPLRKVSVTEQQYFDFRPINRQSLQVSNQWVAAFDYESKNQSLQKIGLIEIKDVPASSPSLTQKIISLESLSNSRFYTSAQLDEDQIYLSSRTDIYRLNNREKNPVPVKINSIAGSNGEKINDLTMAGNYIIAAGTVTLDSLLSKKNSQQFSILAFINKNNSSDAIKYIEAIDGVYPRRVSASENYLSIHFCSSDEETRKSVLAYDQLSKYLRLTDRTIIDSEPPTPADPGDDDDNDPQSQPAEPTPDLIPTPSPDKTQPSEEDKTGPVPVTTPDSPQFEPQPTAPPSIKTFKSPKSLKGPIQDNGPINTAQ